MVRHCTAAGRGQSSRLTAGGKRGKENLRPRERRYVLACKKCVDTVKSDQCHRAAERDDDFVFRIVFCLARVMGKK